MRKQLLGAVAGAAFIASPAILATPAMADVDVWALIVKDKDIFVDKMVEIDKDIDINAFVNINVDKAAEADTIVNQENYDNSACENCAEKLDNIFESITGNVGVVSVNQAAGNMNNQANAVTIAIDEFEIPGDPGDPPPVGGLGFANAQSSVSQLNGAELTGGPAGDQVPQPLTTLAAIKAFLGFDEATGEFLGPDPDFISLFGNTVFTENIPFRVANIEDSVNDNLGVVHVNQSVGNMNNQTNVLTAAISLNAGVALSESDLGQWSVDNEVQERDVNKTAQILGSINRNQGVTGVNQAAGNMANQANIITLGAATMNLVNTPLQTP